MRAGVQNFQPALENRRDCTSRLAGLAFVVPALRFDGDAGVAAAIGAVSPAGESRGREHRWRGAKPPLGAGSLMCAPQKRWQATALRKGSCRTCGRRRGMRFWRVSIRKPKVKTKSKAAGTPNTVVPPLHKQSPEVAGTEARSRSHGNFDSAGLVNFGDVTAGELDDRAAASRRWLSACSCVLRKSGGKPPHSERDRAGRAGGSSGCARGAYRFAERKERENPKLERVRASIHAA